MKKVKAKNTIICFIIFKFFLDLLFINGSSVQYAYLNRTLDFNIIKYVIGWLFYIVFVYFISKIKSDNYRFMIKCIFLLSGVSNFSIYGLRNYSSKYFVIILLFWILMVYNCILFSKNDNKKECSIISMEKISSNVLNVFILIFGIIITIYLVKKFGINVSTITNLYQARENFRSYSLSTIDSYLLSWSATVIFPWLFLIYLDNKKYFKCFIVLIFALLLFGINGMKTWLLLYAIIIAFVFLSKKNNMDISINYILIGLSCLIVISLIFFYTNGSYSLLGMIDRSIILPGEINYYYLDFFSNHELLYLRESIFKIISPSPYSPISSIQISMANMSNAYYHNATNGLIGDIFGNFGIVGIIFYPSMIFYALMILNNSIKNYDISIKCAILFTLMWLLINTSFFTWIMTGGYLLYIIILTFNKRVYIKI